MKAISTAAHTIHRHHPMMASDGDFHATLCGQVVAGLSYWITPNEAYNIARGKVSGYKLCQHCIDREDVQDLHLGVDPANEPLLAFKRAYKAGDLAYRAVRPVLCCSQDVDATLDGEWSTGHKLPNGHYPDQHELVRIHGKNCPTCGTQVS